MEIHVTLLGTGCPSACVQRRGPAQLIRARGAGGTQNILVDCGSGVAQQLVAAGTPGAQIDALLITHYHTDHLIDFYQLVVSSWHQGRAQPWQVFAPRRALAHIRAVMEAWRDERDGRIAFEKRPNSPRGLDVELHELAPGEFWNRDGLAISAIEVDHGPVRPAYGFLFRAGDCRVMLSGDTAPCESLVEAARDVDLLVHEVFLHEEMHPREGLRTQATIDAVATYHTLSSQVGEIAARAGARALALTHFVPPEFDRSALLARVQQAYGGPIFIGEDLMRFELPRRHVHWRGFSARF